MAPEIMKGADYGSKVMYCTVGGMAPRSLLYALCVC
jgi:hypothetical protein